VQPDDITRDDILRWLGMAEGPLFCQRGRTLNLAGRFNGQGRKAVRVGCDAWTCPACGFRKRIRYGVHLGWKLAISLTPVAEEFCAPEGWNARRQRLFQHEADYARIADPSGGWWLFHTGGKCGSAFDSPEAAVRRLGERLLAVYPEKRGKRARPVEMCRAWAFPKELGEYRLLGLLPVANPERLRNALKEAEIPMKEKGRDDRSEWSITYTMDDSARLVVLNGRFVVIPGEPPIPNNDPYGEPSVFIRLAVRPAPYFGVRMGADGPELVVGDSPEVVASA
jgi:hypothetical protein